MAWLRLCSVCLLLPAVYGYECAANTGKVLQIGPVCGGAASSSCSSALCCDQKPGSCALWKSVGGLNVCPGTKTWKEDLSIEGQSADACCMTKPTCAASHSCPAGQKVKANPTSISCANFQCLATECCEDDALKCKGFVSCGTGKYVPDNLLGTARGADEAATIAACCVEYPLCSEVTCGAGYQKEDSVTATTRCAASTCSTTSDCCTNTGMCSAYTCTGDFVKKATAETLVGTDDTACCDAKLVCSSDSVTCPDGYEKDSTKSSATCSTLGCTYAYTECCKKTTPSTLCSDKFDGDCGEGMILKASQALVVGETSAQCCEAKSLCSTFSCPSTDAIAATGLSLTVGMVPKPATTCDGAAVSTCADAECCVEDKARCAGHTCTGANMIKIAALSTIGNTDATCCETQKTCSATTVTCGAGWTLKTGTINCGAPTCTTGECCEEDTTKCYSYRASCGSNKHVPESEYGTAKGTDTTAFTSTCCSDNPECSSVTCAAGYIAVTAKSSDKCAEATCATTSDCCEMDTTKCLHWAAAQSCDAGYSTKTGHESITGADATACCDKHPLCSSVTCATGYKRSSKAATEACTASTCSLITDCCMVDPNVIMCATYTGCLPSQVVKTTTAGSTAAVCCQDKEVCMAGGGGGNGEGTASSGHTTTASFAGAIVTLLALAANANLQ